MAVTNAENQRYILKMTKFAAVFVKGIYAIIFLGLLGACSGYQKLLKNGTPQEKLEGAKEYYNKEDYLRAQPLFEELVSLYYGRPEREEIYYYLAYCHYGMSEYLLAGYHFSNYANTYTLSPKREEATYMAAICEYHRSLAPELEQTSTKKAITNLQAFINQYPNSKYVSEANSRIDELRQRILVKAYSNAKLYYDLGYYQSAIVACKNAVEDYPDIINREELLYLVVAAHYEYAKNSISTKQAERYKDTQTSANEFLKEYPKGEYTERVKTILNKSTKELEIALN